MAKATIAPDIKSQVQGGSSTDYMRELCIRQLGNTNVKPAANVINEMALRESPVATNYNAMQTMPVDNFEGMSEKIASGISIMLKHDRDDVTAIAATHTKTNLGLRQKIEDLRQTEQYLMKQYKSFNDLSAEIFADLAKGTTPPFEKFAALDSKSKLFTSQSAEFLVQRNLVEAAFTDLIDKVSRHVPEMGQQAAPKTSLGL